jgi:hypothetical protein
MKASLLAIAFAIIGSAVFLLMPHRSYQPPRNLEHERLVTLAEALSEYHRLNGSLPPAYTVDRFERPLHSWRTLLLPYLGYEELAKRIDYGKPWNAPENLAQLNRPMECFRGSDAGDLMRTDFVVLVGGALPWRAARGRKVNPLQSIALIFGSNPSPKPWYEPNDIEVPDREGARVVLDLARSAGSVSMVIGLSSRAILEITPEMSEEDLRTIISLPEDPVDYGQLAASEVGAADWIREPGRVSLKDFACD